MELIGKPRGGGKTTEIIKRMKETQVLNKPGSIMLVSDWTRVQALKRMHPELSDSIFTYRHALEGSLNGVSHSGIWIDDVEDYLNQTIRYSHINGFSMSLSTKEWDN